MASRGAMLAVVVALSALLILPGAAMAGTTYKVTDGYGGPTGAPNRPDLYQEADVVGGIGQSFTAAGGVLYRADLLALRSGDVYPSTVRAYIYAADGVFGTSNVPAGSPLAVSDPIDAASIERREDVLTNEFGSYWNTQPWVTFRFSGDNNIQLVKGQKYVVTLNYAGIDGGNIYTYYYDTSTYPLWTTAQVHPGNLSQSASTGPWTDESTMDLMFLLWETFSTPTVDTASATNVGGTVAQGGGTVTSAGIGTVSARGVCWSTSANPTVADLHTSDGTGTGSFTSAITGISVNTVYHVRAYATNEAGTSYGTDLTFTTLAADSPQTPTVSTPASSGWSIALMMAAAFGAFLVTRKVVRS